MLQVADRFEGISGSEIRKIFSYLADPQIISLAGGNPSPMAFPDKVLADIAREIILEEGDRVLQYGATVGVPTLLTLLRRENKGIMRPGDDLITLTGSSQGIDCFARTILNEGDPILVEAPTFLGAIQTFRLARAKIHVVDLEHDGPNLKQLEERIETVRPKFFYTIPTFQNPSGITASLEKRQGVYEICRKHEVLILEDDPYGRLRFEGDPLPSLKSMDEEGIVCRLASFSKTISPGLRVGYAIAPEPIIHCFNLLKQGADVHTSNLSQYLVYEYVTRGFYEQHIREICALYKDHRDVMLGALDAYAPEGMTYTRPEGGLFIWVHLPQGMDARSLFETCIEKKVAFVPGEPFFAHGGHKETLRLNFSMPSCEQIEEAVGRLCSVVKTAMK